MWVSGRIQFSLRINYENGVLWFDRNVINQAPGSWTLSIGLTPRALWIIVSFLQWYLMNDLFLSSGGRSLRFCSSSLVIGRSMGGTAGVMLMWLARPFKFLAFANHMLRLDKSLNLTIIPASAFSDNLWQAAKSQTDAFSISRLPRTSCTQGARVSTSSSLSAPLIPCSINVHFRWWTSMSRVCMDRAMDTRSTWAAKAGRLGLYMSSILLLANWSDDPSLVICACKSVIIASCRSMRSSLSPSSSCL